MTSRRLFLRSAVSAVTLALVVPAAVAGARPRRGRKRRRPRKPIKLGKPSQLPVVRRVGSDTITVGDKDYEVREDAEITVNGEKAELSDIVVGMQALVTGRILEHGRTAGDNTYQATRIQASRNVKPKREGRKK